MIIYLTYNDGPSGIFSSQVIDVVKFFNNDLNTKVRLVSFISIRKFYYNRSVIKQEMPNAIVLPMFPGVQRWRFNYILLKLILFFFTVKIIIGRSVLATHLALLAKSKSTKVVYDGRGAISDEWHEYKVVNHPNLLTEIFELEKQAVLKSNFRIAVSLKLVQHWMQVFKYAGNDYVVIPCTINKQFENVNLDPKIILDKRKAFGLEKEDILFIYSGSIAGWQSFELLEDFITKILKENPKHKMVFFSEPHQSINILIQKFPQQVICKGLKYNEVADHLVIGNYGLLIRDQSVTNQVASPVKFAEYLACGLKVIISDNLGDYSEFIQQNEDFGFCIKGDEMFIMNDQPNLKSQEIRKIALNLYTKLAYTTQYSKIIKLVE